MAGRGRGRGRGGRPVDPGAVVLSLGVDAATAAAREPAARHRRGVPLRSSRSPPSARPSSPSKRADTTCRPSGGSWPRHWTASPTEGQLRPTNRPGIPTGLVSVAPSGHDGRVEAAAGDDGGQGGQPPNPHPGGSAADADRRGALQAQGLSSGKRSMGVRTPGARKAMSTTRSPPARSPPTLEPGALSGPMSAWLRRSLSPCSAQPLAVAILLALLARRAATMRGRPDPRRHPNAVARRLPTCRFAVALRGPPPGVGRGAGRLAAGV